MLQKKIHLIYIPPILIWMLPLLKLVVELSKEKNTYLHHIVHLWNQKYTHVDKNQSRDDIVPRRSRNNSHKSLRSLVHMYCYHMLQKNDSLNRPMFMFIIHQHFVVNKVTPYVRQWNHRIFVQCLDIFRKKKSLNKKV